MPTLATKNPAPTVVQDDVDLPPQFPELPEDVLKRFPSLADWEEDTTAWWNRTSNAIQGNNNWVSQSVTKANQDNGDLRVSLDGFVASITTEIDIIINEQGAQAKRIVTVSAMAGVSQNIKVQNSPPVGPVLNDIWIDNTDLTTPITYEWDGAQWAEVTDPITAAGVADERSARVTADGFLEGKYTLTVIAGNVVTGMNITSSTGGGTNISSVIFRATDFQIYNGVLGKTMFSVSGTDVQLAGVLTTSTSGKIYTGTGTYGNSNTPFYVDSSSSFSLGANLTWNGTTLTITGSISATSGTIGGWTVGATTISKNNATLDSAGQLILGTANDVVYLSATDGTYRLWIGNATAGSAAFSVTKAGVMSATGGIFSGTMTSTSGTIGGFTLGTDLLSAGSGANYIELRNQTGLVWLQLGDFLSVPSVQLQHSSISFDNASVLTVLGGGVSASAGYWQVCNSSGVVTVDLEGSTGQVSCTNFFGGGANITSLSASNISIGTLANARLPSSMQLGDGSAGSPTYSYASDTDTGWYWNSSGDMRASTNGTARLVVRDGAVVLLVPLKFDTNNNLTPLVPTGYLAALDASGAAVRLLTG